MVRTMDSGTRASGAKAPRKGLSAASSSAGGSSKAAAANSGGGNPVCPRETPAWQKPITTFFTNGPEKASAREPCSEQPRTVGESPSPSQPSPQRKEASDDGIKHIDKKIRISGEDSDQENKDNNAQEEANSEDEKPKKKKMKLNVIQDDSE